MAGAAGRRIGGSGSERLHREDPENVLLGRFSSRRLSAEEIHDSLLAVADELKSLFAGRRVAIGALALFWDVSIDAGPEETAELQALLREVKDRHPHEGKVILVPGKLLNIVVG